MKKLWIAHSQSGLNVGFTPKEGIQDFNRRKSQEMDPRYKLAGMTTIL
jgi:hypothetical protein